MECPILGNLKTLDISKSALLALRMVIELGLNQLKEKMATYKLENNQDRSKIALDENGHYCSDDYRPIYRLETHFTRMNATDRFKKALSAVCLMKLLLQTEYFGSNVNIRSPATKKDIILVGSVILTHLMSLPCNGHTISEFQINKKTSSASYFKEIGSGVYAVSSMLNHSCYPNVSRNSYGKRLLIYATRSILIGEEITDSYEFLFASHPKEIRKMELYEQYYFECKCVACVNNWSYFGLNDSIYMLCPFCERRVELSAHQCQNHDVRSTFKNVQKKASEFQKIQKKMLLGSNIPIAETEQLVLDTISALEKHVILPNRVLFDCQETLKFCRDLKGNHWDVVDC